MKDRLLVKRLTEPPRTVTITDRDAYRYFKVIAIGPKVDPFIRVGDVVGLPGIASKNPDLEIEEGQFIQYEDIGFKVA